MALQGSLDAQQRNYIQKLHTSAESPLGVINDILDFSTIEAGELKLESIPFSLGDVMDRLAKLVGRQADEHGMEFLFAEPPDLPTTLLGDSSRLGQLRYIDPIDRSAELLQMAIPLMSRQAAALHPVSYAVWYEYVAQTNAPVRHAVDECLRQHAGSTKRRPTPFTGSRWRKRSLKRQSGWPMGSTASSPEWPRRHHVPAAKPKSTCGALDGLRDGLSEEIGAPVADILRHTAEMTEVGQVLQRHLEGSRRKSPTFARKSVGQGEIASRWSGTQAGRPVSRVGVGTSDCAVDAH